MNNNQQHIQKSNYTHQSSSLSQPQKYSQFLDNLIEDIILAIADGQQIDLQTIHQCFQFDKNKIGFVHVIDLLLVQKLAYVRDKCKRPQICTLIDGEIAYWKHLLLDSLTQTKQETKLYNLSKQQKLKAQTQTQKKKINDGKNGNETKKKDSRR